MSQAAHVFGTGATFVHAAPVTLSGTLMLVHRKEGSKAIGGIAFACFVLTVYAANWAIETFGVVSVGFGLVAPAGVYFAGLAFTFRDVLQHAWGRLPVIAAIAIGAGLSYLIAPAFALASGVAFLVSELADFTVYTPLRKRNWTGAVLASNAVGIVVDSILFLWLAFGSLAFLEGQIVGKAWMTLAAIVVLGLIRRTSRIVLV